MDNIDVFGHDDMENVENTLPSVGFFNFVEKKLEVENSAKIILEGIIDIYFSGKLIEKPEYLELKKKLDEQTLSALMYSLETNMHTCTKILEQIDSGDLNVRLLEVYTRIQQSILEVVKVKTNYVQIIEDNYKKMSSELIEIQEEKKVEEENNEQDIKKISEKSVSSEDGFQTLGTKNAIKHIRDTTEIIIKDELDDKFDARKRAKEELEKEKQEMSKLSEDIDDDILWG